MPQLPPGLSDGVIALRPPAEADVPALVAVIRASASHLGPFMPWATPAFDAAAALAWMRGEREPGQHQFLIIGDDGELAGNCGLDHVNEINHSANMGFWLRHDRTGRGWATRAARLVARHGLTTMGLERVEILVSVENDASRRVAERVGATLEGTLRHRLLLHGRYHDAYLYSLIRGDP